MSLVIIMFQLAFGRGLSEIRHSGAPMWILILGIPACYLWLLIEVGLVEEFFFRCLLQSRISAWLHSEAGGIVLASLLFGLAHAPGLYYRTGKTFEAVGPHPSWLMAVGYSIVIVSVPGLFMGVLWSRTKSLWLLMAVHAAGDLVPQLAPMVRAWL
jgi:membrane protease YdiL (CAAX protease family)